MESVQIGVRVPLDVKQYLKYHFPDNFSEFARTAIIDAVNKHKAQEAAKNNPEPALPEPETPPSAPEPAADESPETAPKPYMHTLLEGLESIDSKKKQSG